MFDCSDLSLPHLKKQFFFLDESSSVVIMLIVDKNSKESQLFLKSSQPKTHYFLEGLCFSLGFPRRNWPKWLGKGSPGFSA